MLLFKGEGLSLVPMPGQRADCTPFEAVMERIRVPRLATGRPRTTPESVSADKGYSNRRTRAYLRGRGIRHVIPEEADQAADRLRRGRMGGAGAVGVRAAEAGHLSGRTDDLARDGVDDESRRR